MSDVLSLQHFVAAHLGLEPGQLNCQALGGDASFRRYFRCQANGQNFIAAIAPPATEKNHEFVLLAKALAGVGVHAPEVLAVDFEQGFILQEDLGNTLLADVLNEQTVDSLYAKALQLITEMAVIDAQALGLGRYDKQALMVEMQLFPDWFLEKLLQRKLQTDEQNMLAEVFSALSESARAQPQVFVHRDYHSRNILLRDDAELAVIDFQDGLHGPITYDAVSILKDCYVKWPGDVITQKLQLFYAQAQQNLGLTASFEQFERWFDWMGLQRHLKVLGIFARLALRDGKQRYLEDLPLVVHYVLEAAQKYPEFGAFYQWFHGEILPLCRQQPFGRAL